MKVIGALVAGLDAGMIYDTFPLMGNSFVPDDYVSSKYTNHIQNILENPAAVQFNHRIAGISCVCLAAYLYKKCRNISLLKRPATAVLHSSLLQMGLGICTVLYGVPVSMASAHQINSMAMLTSVLWLLKVLCK
ncbi:hypothetical protein GJ496_002050 [Pomphorhynchus laevis]|nr:hypothetical protein GJ496_002050 [Pomphorhynchus laevis]